jgi:hypothetical protein
MAIELEFTAPPLTVWGPRRRAVAPAARASDWEHTEGLGQNPPVGFNPFRQQRRRSTDYVMVAAAFVVVAVLLIWAMLPA